jgi:8-oxo-dGTP pyrophosphatase MutT (NUDIX family)
VRVIVVKTNPEHELVAVARAKDAAPRRLARSAKLAEKHRTGVQYAALPYRLSRGLEILLVTSRETGRWILPKGWPMKGKRPHVAAAREAFEEAGVTGKVGRTACGSFHYGKQLGNGAVVGCVVQVYPLAVDRQKKRWPEQGQRTVGWFTPAEAAAAVSEPELAKLIEAFAISAQRKGTPATDTPAQ